MSEGTRPIRTVNDVDRTAFHRAETRVRVTGVVVMGLIVVAALTGFLGPRESTHTIDGAAGTLEVTHPQLTRPGLDAEIVVVVEPLTAEEPVRRLLILHPCRVNVRQIRKNHRAPSGVPPHETPEEKGARDECWH